MSDSALTKPLLSWPLSPQFRLGLMGMGSVMLYVALRHVQWKTKPESQKRMLVHHAVFWPVLILGLRGMHLSFKHFKNNYIKMAAGVFTSSGLAIGGFEGGGWLAKKLFPKKPKAALPNNVISTQQWQQAFQAGWQQGYAQARTQPFPSSPSLPYSPTSYKPGFYYAQPAPLYPGLRL